jgi:hypothetical protein
MIRKLIKLANHLDSRGFAKEADALDNVIGEIVLSADTNGPASIAAEIEAAPIDDKVKQFVYFLKSLESPQERPSGFRKGSLKKEKIGKSCCWCDKQTLVGVEHIIPRSAGGPPVEKWNLAWACYPCNHLRGPSIGLPPRDREILDGWLTAEFDKITIPSTQELKIYLSQAEDSYL